MGKDERMKVLLHFQTEYFGYNTLFSPEYMYWSHICYLVVTAVFFYFADRHVRRIASNAPLPPMYYYTNHRPCNLCFLLLFFPLTWYMAWVNLWDAALLTNSHQSGLVLFFLLCNNLSDNG